MQNLTPPLELRVAFLSWRDTTHPDGGGSEVFVESVGRELALRGHAVTLVCARHPGAARRETRDGVRLRRLGGRLTVYLWGLAWLVRHRRDVDVVVDVVNGLPFASPLVRRHGVVALVHHVHAEQWRIIYPGLGESGGDRHNRRQQAAFEMVGEWKVHGARNVSSHTIQRFDFASETLRRTGIDHYAPSADRDRHSRTVDSASRGPRPY